jgi:hypothetical protein
LESVDIEEEASNCQAKWDSIEGVIILKQAVVRPKHVRVLGLPWLNTNNGVSNFDGPYQVKKTDLIPKSTAPIACI